MFIDFVSNAKRTYVMTHDDGSISVFKGGRLRTANKQEIENIMRSPEFNVRKEIQLETAPDLVGLVLDGKIPDRFTDEITNNVSDEGLRLLATHYGLSVAETGNSPSVIKRLLSGRYLDNRAHEIVREYKVQLEGEELLEKLLETEVMTRNGAWYSYGDEFKSNKKEEVIEWVNQNADKLSKQMK